MVQRRARFNLAKAEKRLHLVQGFLTALTDLDQIVKLIRAADDGQYQHTSSVLLSHCLPELSFIHPVTHAHALAAVCAN